MSIGPKVNYSSGPIDFSGKTIRSPGVLAWVWPSLGISPRSLVLLVCPYISSA